MEVDNQNKIHKKENHKSSNFQTGIKAYQRVLPFIRKNRLWKFFVIPFFVTLFLFSAALFGAFKLAPALVAWFADFTNYEDWSFKWAEGIIQFLNATLSLLIGAGMLLGFYFTYKYIVLTILSPFLSYLSDKTENRLTGSQYPFSWKNFWSDMGRGVRMGLRNFSREIPLTLPLFFLSFVPGLAVITTPLIFIISAYFVGFSMIDYFYERRRFGVKQTAQTIWKQRGYAIAIGAGFNLLFLIPILGLTLAPLMAVIAATIGLVAMEEGKG